MKNILIKVNTENSVVGKAVEVSGDGKPTVIQAQGKGANYELVDQATSKAPNHIVTKRSGKNLIVSFDKDGQSDDLIIEGFYETYSALIGQAEDGAYYYYVPDTGEVQDFVTELKSGDVEGQALGGEAQPSPYWMGAVAETAGLGMGWLAGVAGLGLVGAAIAGGSDDGGKGDKGDKGQDGTDGKDGADGKDGQDGADGADGKDGDTPFINENGNWQIGDVDTGVKAKGQDGTDGKDGADGADGADGKDGQDGADGQDGKDGVDGQDGDTPRIGDNGNWFIGETDTGIKAQGPKGDTGATGPKGEDGVDGQDGKDLYASPEVEFLEGDDGLISQADLTLDGEALVKVILTKEASVGDVLVVNDQEIVLTEGMIASGGILTSIAIAEDATNASVQAKINYSNGNVSEVGKDFALVDILAPTVTVDAVTNVDTNSDKDLDASIVTGKTDTPNAVITVTNANGGVIGTGKADADGNYSIRVPLLGDAQAIKVTAKDVAKNVSEPVEGVADIILSKVKSINILDDFNEGRDGIAKVDTAYGVVKDGLVGNVADNGTTNDKTPTIVVELDKAIKDGYELQLLRVDSQGSEEAILPSSSSDKKYTFKDTLTQDGDYTYKALIVKTDSQAIETETTHGIVLKTEVSAPTDLHYEDGFIKGVSSEIGATVFADVQNVVDEGVFNAGEKSAIVQPDGTFSIPIEGINLDKLGSEIDRYVKISIVDAEGNKATNDGTHIYVFDTEEANESGFTLTYKDRPDNSEVLYQEQELDYFSLNDAEGLTDRIIISTGDTALTHPYYGGLKLNGNATNHIYANSEKWEGANSSGIQGTIQSAGDLYVTLDKQAYNSNAKPIASAFSTNGEVVSVRINDDVVLDTNRNSRYGEGFTASFLDKQESYTFDFFVDGKVSGISQTASPLAYTGMQQEQGFFAQNIVNLHAEDGFDNILFSNYTLDKNQVNISTNGDINKGVWQDYAYHVNIQAENITNSSLRMEFINGDYYGQETISKEIIENPRTNHLEVSGSIINSKVWYNLFYDPISKADLNIQGSVVNSELVSMQGDVNIYGALDNSSIRTDGGNIYNSATEENLTGSSNIFIHSDLIGENYIETTAMSSLIKYTGANENIGEGSLAIIAPDTLSYVYSVSYGTYDEGDNFVAEDGIFNSDLDFIYSGVNTLDLSEATGKGYVDFSQFKGIDEVLVGDSFNGGDDSGLRLTASDVLNNHYFTSGLIKDEGYQSNTLYFKGEVGLLDLGGDGSSSLGGFTLDSTMSDSNHNVYMIDYENQNYYVSVDAGITVI